MTPYLQTPTGKMKDELAPRPPVWTLDEAVSKLRAVLTDGKSFLQQLWIDESAFFVATSGLKKTIGEFSILHAPGTQPDAWSALFVHVDELEQTVEEGKGHFMGKVLVPQLRLEEKVGAVEAAVRTVQATARAVTAEDIMADAEARAAAIVEEAAQRVAAMKNR